MEDKDINQIIINGEKLLNIEITSYIIDDIISFSYGLPSVCHQLCLNMCYSKDILRTSNNKIKLDNQYFEEAIKMYLADNSDTLKGIFDKAIHKSRKSKYEGPKEIIKAMIEINKKEFNNNEILMKIRKTLPSYPQGSLSACLKQFQSEERGDIIKYDRTSNKYYFTNPFFKSYARFALKDDHAYTYNYDNSSINEIMELVIAQLRK
ncbi:MAG: hypothetical protein HQK89_13415 [Nitrospirae bacterium]|nr:hypothetical protein [Nitrospirota bacterium]